MDKSEMGLPSDSIAAVTVFLLAGMLPTVLSSTLGRLWLGTLINLL